MANSYIQFSEMLSALTPEQVEWLRTELSGPQLPADMTDQLEQEAFVEQWFVERGLVDSGCHGSFSDMAECWPGFECQLRPETAANTAELWVFSIEAAELEHLANIVQRFLRRFRPDACFGLTWAGTCSKLRIGEFGGGAVFVTAESVEWMSTWGFIEERRQQFEKSKNKEAKKKRAQTPRRKEASR